MKTGGNSTTGTATTDESSNSKTLPGRRKETSTPTSTVWVAYLISTPNGQSPAEALPMVKRELS